MKLTLIKPSIGCGEHGPYVDEGRMEPLTLGVLAGLTPHDVEVVLYDDRIETIPYDEATDLVAITVETYTARRSYEIANEYRRRGVKVILGGMHVALLPEEASQHGDSIFVGDAEAAWTEVISDARQGRLKSHYSAPPGPGQFGGVIPRRDLYRGKGYLPISLLQFSRGCRFACTFCAVSQYFGRRHFLRRIDEVVNEIERQDRKFLFFVDDNIASDRVALKELCQALTPLKIQWIGQASLDVTHDAKLMSLMAKSGCWGHVMGFESISELSLRDARKGPNLATSSHYAREVAALRDHGLQTWAAFTLGYDHDSVASIRATVDFALDNRFAFAAYNILMPYPGTPLYRWLAEQRRLLYGGRWWLHPKYRFNHAAFVPANMSADELTAACQAARQHYNSLPALIKRLSDWQTNLRSLARAGCFLRYSMLFRREVRRKHGMKFGRY